MSPRQRFALLCAILAAAAGTIFFAIATDHQVYAPGARALHFGYDRYLRVIRAHVPFRYRRDINAYFLLRKLYSIVAFGIVGFLAAPAIQKRRRILNDALVVGGFSTAIEIGQKLTGTHESLFSNAFDVCCGIVGGIIGAIAWNLASAAVRRFGGR